MSGAEIEFDKYAKKGAYHWREVGGKLGEINAYTLGRYDLALDCLRAAGVRAGQSLLDIGCGDGALAGLAHRRAGLAVTGVDPTPAAIALARECFAARQWAGRFEVADAYDTGLPAESFDAAVSADVIEHVRHPERLLAEARRLLKPGGVLVVTTPLRVSEKPFDPLHVQEWYAESFAAFCAAHFGPVSEQRLTHPALWYEIYRASGSRWGQAARLAINALAKSGRNPFLWRRPAWTLHTQQAVVLRKPA